MEEIEADYWAHHFYDHPVSESGEDEDWDREEIIALMEKDDWEECINVGS